MQPNAKSHADIECLCRIYIQRKREKKEQKQPLTLSFDLKYSEN